MQTANRLVATLNGDLEATATPVSQRRLCAAKRAFTTRNVQLEKACGLITGGVQPHIGDLALARVTSLGQHKRIEAPSGRRCTLHVGDEVIVAFGGRYATDQFHAEPPNVLKPCELVAGGGVAAAASAKHSRMKGATKIAPIGLLADAEGRPMNLVDYPTQDLADPAANIDRPPIVAVLGTSMNAGKTAAVASLVRGGAGRGERIGVAKITGTGSGGDLWAARDAGAFEAIDFTDAGYPSTYKIGAAAILDIFDRLTATLAERGAERIVVEIADGLLFKETADLVQSDLFAEKVDRIVLAAGDGMGAVASERMLQDYGYQAATLTGVFTSAPLALAEVAAAAAAPVTHTDDLISFDLDAARPALPAANHQALVAAE